MELGLIGQPGMDTGKQQERIELLAVIFGQLV